MSGKSLNKSNSELLKEYLQGAKELEWNKYTIEKLRDGINSKIAAYTKKRDDDLKTISSRQNDNKRLQDKIDNYKRGTYYKSKYKFKFEPEWDGCVLSVFIWAVITAVFVWIGENKNIRLLSFPMYIEQFLAEITTPFWGVVLHFLVLPVAVYLAILLILEFRKKRIFEYNAAESERKSNESAARQEADSKKSWSDTIKANNDQIAALEKESSEIDGIVLPELREELSRNASALAAAQRDLDSYYAPGVLHINYQGLVPVSTICGYFETGRCDSLGGHEGAYNLYESEYRLNMINAKLDTISDQLRHISAQNQQIQNAIGNLRATVSGLMDSVDECTIRNLSAAQAISAGTAQIAQSTQMQNYYNYAQTNALRHLDYMTSVDYYRRHIF